MTLCEAAFFGCPSITVDDFALRESTSERNRRLLLQRPVTSDGLGKAMVNLLDSPADYQQARHSARDFAISKHTQEAFKIRLQEAVLKACRET
jgi:glycosyltransferase involved in cell wall biosynthesis